MELSTFCLVTIFLLVLTYFFSLDSKTKRRKILIDKIPGPKCYPIIGSSYELMVPKEKLLAAIVNRANRYLHLPFFRTWVGPIATIHLFRPEHLELLMGSIGTITKGSSYRFLTPWLGTGLLTSEGYKWHSHRKMITPAFHFKILESFVDVFIEKSEILLEKLDEQAGKGFFDVFPYITHCALDIICKTAMGVEIDAMRNCNSDYVRAVYDMSEVVTKRGLRPWYHFDSIFYLSDLGKRQKRNLSILHGFTSKVIAERKESLKKSSRTDGNISEEDALLGRKNRKAFLDILLEASLDGATLTDAEIREEVDTFMFEGHDTTTAGISWNLLLLGNHPEIQEKVAQELDEIFQGEDRPITMRDLAEMNYLERVMKETLRLYPSVPFISRTITNEIELDGYTIPVGTSVVFMIYTMHRRPELYPDPERFDPDRFLQENAKSRHPYAYVPFSAGPRNCIGQKFAIYEEKVMLASILRKYKVKCDNSPVQALAELVLRPRNGVRIQLEPRKPSTATSDS